MIYRPKIKARLIRAIPALLALAAGAGVSVAVASGGSTLLGQTTTAPVYGAEAPVVQLSTTPGTNPYTTPRGVLTSWRYHSSPDTPAGTVRLELFHRVAPPGVYEAVATSDAETLEPDSGYRFPVRIPVKRGWALGLDPSDDAEVGINVPMSNGDQMFQFTGDVPVGSTATATGPFPTYRVNVAATVEPDADRDRYGDRSQDGCPTQAATHRRCSNRFSLGRLKRDKGDGTVAISVTAPGPGKVSLRGKGVIGRGRAIHRISPATTVTLLVKAKGSARHRLERKGRVSVRTRITYKPAGGRPRTKSEGRLARP